MIFASLQFFCKVKFNLKATHTQIYALPKASPMRHESRRRSLLGYFVARHSDRGGPYSRWLGFGRQGVHHDARHRLKSRTLGDRSHFAKRSYRIRRPFIGTQIYKNADKALNGWVWRRDNDPIDVVVRLRRNKYPLQKLSKQICDIAYLSGTIGRPNAVDLALSGTNGIRDDDCIGRPFENIQIPYYFPSPTITHWRRRRRKKMNWSLCGLNRRFNAKISWIDL